MKTPVSEAAILTIRSPESGLFLYFLRYTAYLNELSKLEFVKGKYYLLSSR